MDMGSDINLEGIDELEDELERRQELIEVLQGRRFDQLFNPGFMRKHSDFKSIEEFFDSSPWEVDSEEDLKSIPGDDLDAYAKENTDFDGFIEVLISAGESQL